MPTYEYECSACQFRFERNQRFDAEPVAICPQCQGKARRVLHSVPIFFRGSGFYSTDYGRGSRSSSPKKKKKPEEEGGAGKDTATKD
ncbi:MAG: zinc ribbon domain-containing protein [Dehalococcoidia bacterium]|jgi:putative FmdB family regulatory protein|nr:zinc ribbon domain-containing protein [Chloroflexota bacterium]MCK4242298.1 zinc ribbon domain-containing protein [Dehalococcoidia bacterium]